MARCTICGSQHDSEAGVVQHIFMSGGDHEDWNDKGRIWRNSSELIDGDVNESSDSGGSVEFPEADSGGDDSDGDELPCGHEEIDPSEAPDPPYLVTCDTCGVTWEVED